MKIPTCPNCPISPRTSKKNKKFQFTCSALRKHAYSNIMEILQPKKDNFQIKLEMCQYDTDAPTQGHPQPHTGILQTMKLKKGTNQSFLKKISEGKHLLKVKKGHNSHNNGLILPYLEPDLYFMIYTCVLNLNSIH